ncbi:MAG: mycofactocin system GMC family oxidoreductase MftG [Tomitella sp.]|nr:mycofactocin system GMC family oxidoreductase MftG [Tomitella sp.]
MSITAGPITTGLITTGADVVIVGGGSCGSVLAARLSEDSARSVLLLESGAPGGVGAGPTPAHLLPIGPDSERARSYRSALGPDPTESAGSRTTLVRGRGIGGSGAVNGAYFVRATAADLDAWDRAAGGSAARRSALWTYDAALPYFRRSELDCDFGENPVHGSAGPIPVRRQAERDWHPVTARIADAARSAGFPDEADKNGPGPAGFGPVPCNIDEGLRIDPASAYLGLTDPEGAFRRPNLTIATSATVRRIVMRAGSAVGVEVDSGGGTHTITAGTVVIAGGAIESPALLWRSGIGDPHVLGADTRHPLPGVGREFSDHPEITIPYVPEKPEDHTPAPLLEACLNTDDGIEIRPYTASFGDAVPGNPPMPPVIGAAVMAPHGRGTLRPHPADPHGAPVIEHRYFADPRDREAARVGIDLARGLLAASGIGRPGEPRVGTSQHLCGTCPMGADQAVAVVDDHCRVHGIDGLFVVDTSVFPRIPSRGPHATAVMLAERAAEFIAGAPGDITK